MSAPPPTAEVGRLADELAAARQHQAAMTEVFDVINASAGELAPVFAAVLDKATRLCDFAFSILWTYDGTAFRAGALHGVPPRYADWLAGRAIVPPPDTEGAFWQFVSGKDFFHNDDVAATPLDALTPRARGAVEFGGARTNMLVALRKDGRLLGAIEAYRTEVRPFSDKQIGVLRSFAAQAALAIENARLIAETREALAQQTATAEVLQVINASPGALAPVFDAMLEKSMRLCEAAFGQLAVLRDGRFETVATRGMPEAFVAYRRSNPPDYGPGTQPARLLAGEHLIHVVDLKAEALYAQGDPNRRALVDLGDVRTSVMVPLLRDGAVLGFINLYRRDVRPFAERQIALLQSFAAQAVIAIENARLINETRESLEYQTATSDVLKVMSHSAFDLLPVLQTVCETARRLCDVDMTGIWRPDGEVLRCMVNDGSHQTYDALQRDIVIRPGRGSLIGRVAVERRTVEIEDAWADPEYEEQHEARVGQARSLLGVPLLREGALIGIIGLARHRVERFSRRQIELVETFADQAVIAIENVRLINETRAARDAAENALRDLKTAQASLIQAEKLASLGQLTAGIAHEIKNPLNFVNNFASLSNELLAELKQTVAPALAALDADARADLDDTLALLSSNLAKIAEHGKRADNIVKSMLAHSRGAGGERQRVDLNALLEEALNLAYHGARAQDQGFNITLERDFAPALPAITVVPQDVTRVFLNLFGNGFYAAKQRAQAAGAGFAPVLRVTTRDAGDAVEVRVRDNGTGIPPAARDKLFEPFFTTKPTGEGTGLGLSISYDIVTKQHGGTIAVDSEEGAFTEFVVRLPRGGA